MNSQHPAAAPAPRRNWVRRLANLLVALVVIAVAAATFVFSYNGVRAIALLGGMSAQLARYYPGLFDAVLVIACVAAIVLRDARWWARAWAWVVLVVVLAAIGATDVVHAMNYTLRQRTTEGIVAAAPVAAVLLAFTLLLTLLRQSRSHGAAPAEDPGDWAARPSMTPVQPGLPALPAAPAAATEDTRASMADAATIETHALPAGPAIRPPAEPIALPAGQETGPMTPPDGLPAMTRTATEPDGTLPPAPPPLASQRAPEGDPAPPTVSSPALAPARPSSAAAVAEPAVAEPAVAEPAPARPHSIRYAGGGTTGRAGDEPSAAEPSAELTAEPGATATEPDAPRDDYWDGDDAGQFAGLVYPAREADPGSAAAAGRSADSDRTQPIEAFDDHAGGGDDDDEASGPGPRSGPQEIDEDAPPFATAPFAAVPRLNRVRSMPVPPEGDEAG